MNVFQKRLTKIELLIAPKNIVYPAMRDCTEEQLLEIIGLPDGATEDQLDEIVGIRKL